MGLGDQSLVGATRLPIAAELEVDVGLDRAAVGRAGEPSPSARLATASSSRCSFRWTPARRKHRSGHGPNRSSAASSAAAARRISSRSPESDARFTRQEARRVAS
jgi:hypothetical protein